MLKVADINTPIIGSLHTLLHENNSYLHVSTYDKVDLGYILRPGTIPSYHHDDPLPPPDPPPVVHRLETINALEWQRDELYPP